MDSDEEDAFDILESDDHASHGGDSSGSEFAPSDGGELQQDEDDESDDSDGVAEDPNELHDDETAYLTGTSAGETDIEGGMDSDGASDLFDEGFDPQKALQEMGEQAERGGTTGSQPYQVLASRRRAAARTNPPPRRARASSGQGAVHGADVDEIARIAGVNSGRPRKAGRRGRPPGTRRKKTMPKEAEDLLGQANLLYAKNRNKEAIELCQEVIRLAPNAADAYHTIGTIQEAMGNPRKALDFYMIAAHLPPKDLDLWRRLARMSADQGFQRQAIYCLNKVLFSDKGDLNSQWDRAVLYSDINEPRKAIKAFEKLIEARPGDDEVVKVLARLHFRVKDSAKAKEVLQRFAADHPEAMDLTCVNILAELHIGDEEWAQASQLIADAATQLCADGGLPIDLQVKRGMCALRQGDEAGAILHFDALRDQDAAECGDLFLQVAELWLLEGRPAEALPFLQAVRDSGGEFDGPQVWAQLCDCLQATGDVNGAILVYQDAIADLEEGTPEFMDATLALADLLCKVGSPDEASQLLLRGTADDPMVSAQGKSLPAVMRRAQLLLQLGQDAAFLATAEPAVWATVRHFEAGAAAHERLAPEIRKALRRRARRRGAPEPGEERGTMFKGFQTRDRRKPHIVKADEEAEAFAAQLTDAETEGEGDDEAAVLTDVVRNEEQFQLVVATARALVRTGQAPAAAALCDACLALFSKRWQDKAKRDAVRMVAAEAALAMGDPAAALAHVKLAGGRWPHSRLVWATFARVLGAMGAINHTAKYVRSQRLKHPDAEPLMMLLGHCYASQGTHEEALGQYFHAYRLAPAEPLLVLSIGVAFLNQAMTRKVEDRHFAVVQCFAFLREYGNLRGQPQEAAYNMGRAAHQLGLLHLAVPLYERALEAEAGGAGDVQREAAHNLALIYRRSGAPHLARKVLRTHFTV